MEENKDIYKYNDDDNLVEVMAKVINSPMIPKNSNCRIEPTKADENYTTIDKVFKFYLKTCNDVAYEMFDLKQKFYCNNKDLSFDFDNNALSVEFDGFNGNTYNVKIKKENDDLIIVDSNYFDNKGFILKNAKAIYEAFDFFTKYKKYYTEDYNGAGLIGQNIIHTYKTPFDLSINQGEVYLEFAKDKRLGYKRPITNEEYDLDGFNSYKEISYIDKNLNILLNNIYVKMDELPVYITDAIKNERNCEEMLEKAKQEADEHRMRLEEEKELKKEKHIPFYKMLKKHKKSR